MRSSRGTGISEPGNRRIDTKILSMGDSGQVDGLIEGVKSLEQHFAQCTEFLTGGYAGAALGSVDDNMFGQRDGPTLGVPPMVRQRALLMDHWMEALRALCWVMLTV